MAVPKKRTSLSKKRIRQNIWKNGVLGSEKSIFISEISFYREFEKFFVRQQKRTKSWKNLNQYDSLNCYF